MGITKILLRLLSRLLLLTVVTALVLVLIEPLLIRHGLKPWLIHRAKNNGSHLAIREIKGSFLRGIAFQDMRLESTRSGVTTVIDLRQAQAAFDWKRLLFNRGSGFFSKLTLSDLSSTIAFTSRSNTGKIQNRAWLPAPARLELQRGELAIHIDKQSTSLTGIHFEVDTTAPGTFTIERLAIGSLPGDPGASETPPTRVYENLHGTTAFQSTKLVLAGVGFTPDLFLKTVSTDLHHLNRGRIRVAFDFDAFGGSIRGELVNTPKEERPHYEITGSFSSIAVKQLASFLNAKSPAGGLIDEGKFTFRGSPHALDKATFTTRLEAHNFQWGQRQWNTLVLGASIVNARLQIPEFHLKQQNNVLQLKGEASLPAPGEAWWETEFAFDVAARFDDLKELSALLGENPLTDLSGRLTIDGNVRGRNKTFNGHLIVAGSKLTYRETPFDILNAGLKLEGNEVQVINLEMARGRDFVRGKGNISILGKTRYSGELQINIDKLEAYEKILQKPITPCPLEGGVILDWAGDGTLDAHSGAITASFHKLRTPGSDEIAASLPVDAELVGTYAPGRFSLTSCRIAHGETRLETRLAASGNTLTIDGLRLSKKNVPWLEGSARLPINLSQWWLTPDRSALHLEQPLTVQLLANGIRLEDVALLTGRAWPIGGLLSGAIQAEGTLKELAMNGSITLTKAKLPPSSFSPALEDLHAHADLEGRTLHLSQFTATISDSPFTASGQIDFTDSLDPAIELSLTRGGTSLSTGEGWSGTASAHLKLSGNLSSAHLSGSIDFLSLKRLSIPDFAPLSLHSPTASIPPPSHLIQPPSHWDEAPHLLFEAPTLPALLPIAGSDLASQWSYDVKLQSKTPLPFHGGSVGISLLYRGAGPMPVPTGSVTCLAMASHDQTVSSTLFVENATFFWENRRDDKTPGDHAATTVSASLALQETEQTTGYLYVIGSLKNPTTTLISRDAMQHVPFSLRPVAPSAPSTETGLLEPPLLEPTPPKLLPF